MAFREQVCQGLKGSRCNPLLEKGTHPALGPSSFPGDLFLTGAAGLMVPGPPRLHFPGAPCRGAFPERLRDKGIRKVLPSRSQKGEARERGRDSHHSSVPFPTSATDHGFTPSVRWITKKLPVIPRWPWSSIAKIPWEGSWAGGGDRSSPLGRGRVGVGGGQG